MFKVLIVEDDEKIRNELFNILKNNNFNPVKIETFDKVFESFNNIRPDLVILDINLDCDDGFNICMKIREVSNVPIIFVTSRDNNMDELMSITIGGDDFITKPYNTHILLARINSILKRTYKTTQKEDILEINGVKLNMLSSKVEYNNLEIELTKNELKILYYIMTNNEKIVSRVDILDYLWDSSLFVNDNTLTVNITRIRAKLEELGITDFIKTKRGYGYYV
ncbi:MAG: response regulator transcription factor [Peptostreptococcaceae bacterium]